LFPFSLLYAAVTRLRNFFYDKGWLKSYSFNIPVIAVGNLSVGGTGKTPMIEYLVRLLKDDHNLAILSRGYGRKTSGFLLGTQGTNAEKIGDEPYQFYRKFDDVKVAVDENRVRGVQTLLEEKNPPDAVLLDDAYQHRRIRAGFYILMTSYGKLYSEDWVLPAGNLREPRSGSKRANVVVVSKCPDNMNENERNLICDRLNLNEDQEVFFTGIEYAGKAIGNKKELTLEELSSYQVLLVTGIANPSPLLEYLSQKEIDATHLKFSDHHQLSPGEHARIESAFGKLPGKKKTVLTTEKDYVRNFESSELPVYYLPIQTRFYGGEELFKQIIHNYVRKN
jgi:tetraacyldisaccharide 4'-kinase